MPFYWSYKSVPELASLPRKRAKVVWEECINSAPFSSLELVFNCIGVVGTILLLALPLRMSFLTISWSSWWLGAFVVWTQGFFYVNRHLRAERALPELRKRIGGLCPNCGYDL